MTRITIILLALAMLLAAGLCPVALAQDTSNTSTAVTGRIKSVDSNNSQITVTVQRGESSEDQTYDVLDSAAITIDGKDSSLNDVQPGESADLTLTTQRTSVSSITIGKTMQWWVVVLMLVAAVAVSCVAGSMLGKSFRMTDYGWRIGVILSSVTCGLIIVWAGWPPRLGVDLRGGVTLIYEIAEPEVSPTDESGQIVEEVNADALVDHLKDRVNPSGTKEVVVRAFGSDRVEIIVPDVGQTEVENIKRAVTQAGYLKFRIIATPTKHAQVIETARLPENQDNNVILDSNNQIIGRWVRVKREADANTGTLHYKTDVSGEVIRDAKTKQEIEIPPTDRYRLESGEFLFGPNRVPFEDYLEEDYLWDGRQGGISEIEVLMATNDQIDLEGTHLSSVRSGYDQIANPCINFDATPLGAIKFNALTSEYIPNKQTGASYRLGIVLDNDLISAPTIQGVISDRGQVTGRFSAAEVDYLVNILRAGKLPAALKEQPLSEDRIDSSLGHEMRNKGVWAIGVSLGMVVVFMAVYYRFSGIVACLALTTNLILIVALVILVKQPFTLTGLAGIVLTVGMSVDANVLIFERIREELDRGSTLRMAIRNGFARATTTIVDANLTTLITAIVLYAIGTDQLRGFAVALILGILISMYTAIFCSRVIFDVCERQRWITSLGMRRLLGSTSIDFIGKRTIAAGISVVLIIIGLFAVYLRGKGIFDIDLAGGTSVRIVLQEPMPVEEVRKRMGAALGEIRIEKASVSYNASEVQTDDLAAGTVYRIDTSIPESPPDEPDKYPRLTDVVQQSFSEDGKTLLAMNSLEFEPPQVVTSDEAPARQEASPTDSEPTEIEATESEPTESEPTETEPTETEATETETTETEAAETEATEKEQDGTDSSDAASDATNQTSGNPDAAGWSHHSGNLVAFAQDAAMLLAQAEDRSAADSDEGTAPAADDSAAPTRQREQLQTTLNFGYAVDHDTLQDQLLETARQMNINYLSDTDVQLDGVAEETTAAAGFKRWNLRIVATPEDARKIMENLKSDYDQTPYFRGESAVGGQIAFDTQQRAMAALLTSLLGIVGYIWIRFQRVVFGLAAVVALIHDVLIVLGAIAVSYWLADVFGFLKIDEFKISLPVVAAFLTIIGYSLNDTIVVFDRIREVRGKSPDLTVDMINRSIGQTLSRTLLTSLTTLLVVGILYWWGGDAIHGFAFALVVGVVVGTYSSIFVASPALFWMIGTSQPKTTKTA